jgi:Flp pilus assembly protein TadG
MRSRCPADGRERGAVTAEFALAVPAVVLVLAACLGGLRVGVERMRVQDAAAVAARSLARGDPPSRARALASAAGAQSVTTASGDGLQCAVASLAGPVLGLALPVSARSCALGAADPR